MQAPEREFDAETTAKLDRIAARQQRLEAKLEKIDEADEAAQAAVQQQWESLEAEAREVADHAPEFFSEATKAIATAVLTLCPDGQVRREYCVPRRRPDRAASGTGHPWVGPDANGQPTPPTSDDLSDGQLAATFTHQALAVREAVLGNGPVRKRLLALILHEKVRSDALAVRHEPNGTTLHAAADGFASPALDRLQAQRAKLDPFAEQPFVEDGQGYEQLGHLSAAKLDALVDLLVVECVTAHLQRRTELVHRLAGELKVNVRDGWRPDAAWLSGFQKAQLLHLIDELNGPCHGSRPERKKSELVDVLTVIFAGAANGALEDKQLAERANRWLPANLRETAERTTPEATNT